MKDYLAIIMRSGGSSFARGPDKDDAVARCVKIFRDDFGIAKGKGQTITVNVVDVTNHNTVTWDDRGVYSADGQPLDRPVEKVRVPL